MLNIYDIWFSNINISNKYKLFLLNEFKSCEAIWKSDKERLKEKIKSPRIVNEILNNKYKIKLDKYYDYMEKNNIKLVYFYEKEYPISLKFIENKPAFIYIRGEIKNLYCDCVSIIGSRNATKYGTKIARNFAKELADRNVNVVSGLASGIDKFAHLGALDSKIGKTIAVLGNGVSDKEIYPLENAKLFERILENSGTIISEFKLGTKIEKYNFPLRNRIISGLSQKIIVVEAANDSGSLITVEHALNQGKDVFAVPRKY